MNKLVIFLVIFLCINTSIQAQSNAWTRQRYNLYGGIGAINFLGDLGGGRGEAHWFKDLNFSTTRPMLVAGGRYKILEPVAVGAGLAFGWYSGNDAFSKNEFRRERNLHFRSPLLEFSVYGEYHIIKEKFGKRTSQPKRRNSAFSWQAIQALPINLYVFGGAAGFWFNPKAQYIDGKWYALQPLGTEGQNFLPTKKRYKRLQMSFPFGLGVRYSLDRRFSIGLEYGVRYTTTDYMDDASGNYVHWSLFDDPIARYFADPNKTFTREYNAFIEAGGDPLDFPYLDSNGRDRNIKIGTNNRRGGVLNNDYYMFTVVTLSYKMRTGPNGLPKF